MNTMGSGMSAHEWHGPQEVPNQQEIIKTLHQELMVKELRIQQLREALDNLSITTDSNAAIRDKALSTPYDDSALRKYVAGEMRKMPIFIGVFSEPVHSYADRYEKGEV